jgi:hypothetical protein
LPFSISFIANIARKRPELNRDKTSGADIQNTANRSGVFSCVQKKKRSRTFPNKGINFAAAAKRFKRYALLVG